MNTSILRLFAALLALAFVVAACSSDSGATWTFAPVAVADTAPAGESDNESITDVEAGDADPDELPAGEGNAEGAATESPEEAPPAENPADSAGAGEPRVIEIEANGALSFTDADGQKIQDIPVVPGETIIFRVDNTAGFAHNFYIGQDSELSSPAATTDTGIPDWPSGVQELEWVVPEDISGLKFGCTVPGHYTLMQGTFSVAEGLIELIEPTEPTEPTEPAASELPTGPTEPTEPAASDAPTEAVESADPGTAVEVEARVIPIEANAALQFTQDGAQIQDIPVTPGEKIIFRVDNTAGFAHNIYIGTDAELSAPAATTDTGIPDWKSGVQHLEWLVPDDITDLKFGCTVPGHYTLMQGTFSVSP